MGKENNKKIQSILKSKEFTGELSKIISRYGVEDHKGEITSLVRDVAGKKIRFSRIGLELDRILGEDPEKNMEILLDLEDLMIDIKDILDEEREEVGEISSEIEGNKQALDALIKDIIKEEKIKISDDVLLKRFQNIAFSWFRDVRDDFETKSTAMRETRVGGLGFNEKQADNFINILKRKEEKFKEQGIELSQLVNKYLDQKEELFKKEHAEDIEIDVPSATQEPPTTVADIIEEKEERIEAHEELMPPKEAPRLDSRTFQSRPKPETIETSTPTTPSSDKSVREVSDEILQKAPAPVTAPAAQPKAVVAPKEKKRGIFGAKKEVKPAHKGNELPKKIKQTRELKQTALSASGRPRVEDIKFTPKLYGPLDELASLSVEDFRRLSKEPEEAVKKLMNKLELLEDDSFEKKAEGVKALHSSDLYKTYTQVLQKSVTEGKSYEDILKENPVITLSELRAIMKLNKQLKQ